MFSELFPFHKAPLPPSLPPDLVYLSMHAEDNSLVSFQLAARFDSHILGVGFWGQKEEEGDDVSLHLNPLPPSSLLRDTKPDVARHEHEQVSFDMRYLNIGSF